MILSKSDKNSASECVSCLKQGKVVIIPTDTVYGFSGLAAPDTKLDTNKRIISIKGRNEAKPFIQLIAEPEDLKKYTDDSVQQSLLSCWPGPLTIIVNNKLLKTTTAFRCPGDSWLRSIITQLDFPIYSTSVNRSGQPVLESQNEIIREFEKEVELIITDGDKKSALPSTIVSIADGTTRLIRQGAVSISI